MTLNRSDLDELLAAMERNPRQSFFTFTRATAEALVREALNGIIAREEAERERERRRMFSSQR